MNHGMFMYRFKCLLEEKIAKLCHGLTFDEVYGNTSGYRVFRSGTFDSHNELWSQAGLERVIDSWLPSIVGYKHVSIVSVEFEPAHRSLGDGKLICVIRYKPTPGE